MADQTPTPTSTPDQFQYVKLPDGQYGKFNADASDEDIKGTIEKHYPGTFRPDIASTVAKPNVQMKKSALGQAVYGPPDAGNLKEFGYIGPAPSQINPYTSSAAMAAVPAGLAAETAPMALRAATKIPGIGRFVEPALATYGMDLASRHIPGAKILREFEWVPWILGGRGKASEGEVVPEASAPKETPSVAKKIPTPESEQPAMYQLGERHVPSTNEIRSDLNAPKPRSRADLEEDKDILQRNREDLEKHRGQAEEEAKRQAIAGSSTGKTKGAMVKEAQQRARGEEDLTPQLEESVKQAKAKKAAAAAGAGGKMKPYGPGAAGPVTPLGRVEEPYPVRVDYDEAGNIVNADGRHRVIEALKRGDQTIAVQTRLANGDVQTLNVPPARAAKIMGVTPESLKETDAQQARFKK